MSWLARSIAATLSSAPDDDDDDGHSEAASGDKSPDRAADADDDEEDEQPDTPGRGVKGDISELTESLTRRFWGVASFLAPPPPPAAGAEADTSTAAAEAEAEVEGEYGPQSPRVAGIRNDLAEIGGRVRSGISMLSNANAVAEISKIASSFLPFVPEEEEEEVDAVGVTEEVVVFVRHISTSPETWRDFPLFVNDRHADDFELSDAQYEHALAIERIVPSLSYLRTELCSTNMSEACFWKIYFVLLHSKLNKEDAELLSTTQILEAREELLQSSPSMKYVASEGPGGLSESSNVPCTQAEDVGFSPSSIQDKSGMSEATSFQEPTPDPLPGAEADKHPISTSEASFAPGTADWAADPCGIPARGGREMNCGPPDQLPPATAGFLNLNWDSSMDAGGRPAMASTPSPASNSAAATEGLALHGISPRHYGAGTPLGSPTKLNLSMMGQYGHHPQHYPPPPPPQVGGAGALPTLENLMPMGSLDQFLADPGFAERAARLSGFDARGGYGAQLGLQDDGPVGALKELELGSARDDSSVSDPASAGAGMALKGASDSNARKRKAAGGSKGKGKDASVSTTSAKDLLAKEDSASKRCKSMSMEDAEENSGKGKAAQSSSENGGKKQGKDGTSKLPEPPKDFIHVRARRGEATDSHSLAERVRREKISQRMKLLQDLVPGCNKVVGKAVMLDEIINYVQSLQRQVEFLSMKLATVNPQLDFNNLPSLLAKDMQQQQQSCGQLQQGSSHFPLEASGAPLPYMGQGNSDPLGGCDMSDGGMGDDHGAMHPLQQAFCRPMGSQQQQQHFLSDAASQVGAFWQDLQSVVQMDMGQSQEIATSSNSYDGSLQTVHMKMEL